MVRSDIITIINTLAKDLNDPDTTDTFLDEVFFDSARRVTPPSVEATIKSVTSGTSEYSFESDMLRILYAIMDDTLLSPTEEMMLDAYSSTWQSDTGTPVAFTQDDIEARNYILYPEPDFTSDALIPVHGEPFGEDWPDNSLLLIYADDKEDNISSIYALPYAFDTIAREFLYPSDHADLKFASLSYAFSQLLYKLVGIKDA